MLTNRLCGLSTTIGQISSTDSSMHAIVLNHLEVERVVDEAQEGALQVDVLGD
jgi:hypothetical protein